MKRVVADLLLLVILLGSISLFVSCESESGEQGPQGIQGLQGVQGWFYPWQESDYENISIPFDITVK